MKPQSTHALKIAEEASAWLMELEEDATPACREAFVAWLKHSPTHLDEFLMVTAAYRAMQGVDPKHAIDVHALLASSPSEIVSLQQDSHVDNAKLSKTMRRPTTLKIAAAAAGLAVITLAAWQGTRMLDRMLNNVRTYATAVGEQRSIKLSDGSVIYLNTRSRVDVHYAKQMREIRLLEGEALFVVEQDTTRPFRVLVGSTVVQALGTQFNIYRQPRTVTVSVLEGRVRTYSDVASAQTLGAGEEIHVTEKGDVAKQTAKQTIADMSMTVAWRHRQLVFHSRPLAEIAAEFNRYNELQLRVDDPALAARRVTGVFNADNPKTLLKFLQTDHGLQVQWRESEVTIRSAKPADREF